MRKFFAVVAAAVAAFFVFYTARLLVVTHMLTTVRANGHGAYVGAIVFPLLAVGFGCVAWRLWAGTTQLESARAVPE